MRFRRLPPIRYSLIDAPPSIGVPFQPPRFQSRKPPNERLVVESPGSRGMLRWQVHCRDQCSFAFLRVHLPIYQPLQHLLVCHIDSEPAEQSLVGVV